MLSSPQSRVICFLLYAATGSSMLMAFSLAQFNFALDPDLTFASAKAQRLLLDPDEIEAKRRTRAVSADTHPRDRAPRALPPALADRVPHGPADPLQETLPLPVQAERILEDLVKCSRIPTVLHWLDAKSWLGPTGTRLTAW